MESLQRLAARSPPPLALARFGLAILADRWTVFTAGVAAVSISATVGYLALVAALEGGLFLDVLVRDVGLAALAWAVTVDALRS